MAHGETTFEHAFVALVCPRAATILQLSVYSDLLQTLQEACPEKMYVIKPVENFQAEQFRVADFQAYYRLIKRNFEEVMAGFDKLAYGADKGRHYPLISSCFFFGKLSKTS